MTLRRYRERSPAGRSPEPPGRQRTDQPRGASAEALRSAVQHHEASSDHHDFRLDFDDVLAPRAAPNGPSINPKNKRMARTGKDRACLPVMKAQWVLSGRTFGERS
jgi:hypothetical protein